MTSEAIEFFQQLGIEHHHENNIIYKYTSAEAAIAIFEKCSLRYSAICNFNDPFEFYRPFIDLSCTEEQMNEILYNHFVKARYDLKDFEYVSKQVNLNKFKLAYIDTLENERQKSLLHCFSEVRNNILMWSHYAEKHTGICIGFKIPSLADNGALTMKVKYSREINPINLLTANNRAIPLLNWVYSKSDVWSYEKEIRTYINSLSNKYTLDENSRVEIPLQPEQIRSISFGVNTKGEYINRLLSIIKIKGYDLEFISKMNIGNFSFELTELEIA